MVKLLNEIFDIVQREIPSSFETFIVDKSDMKQIFKNVKHCILSYKEKPLESDLNLNSCNSLKHKISSSKKYVQKTETWFKKYKAKIYGNCCLYPVIFIHILKVCLVHFYI